MPSSSHVVNEPRAFSAAFPFVVRYWLRRLFFTSVMPSVYRPWPRYLCIKARWQLKPISFLQKLRRCA